MSNNSLVSVIIIFLNAEKYIQEAIESVWAQTYPHWELLLVDDGSTDASSEIGRDYADKRPGQVRFLKHPDHQNRGMSASRNLGISQATGDYVAFLDADDVWLPQKLEQQVAILEARPEAGMLYGNTQYWYSWTGNPEDKGRDFIPELGVQPDLVYDPPTLLARYLAGKAAVPCTCSIFVRREALERIGGFEESFHGMYEDQAFYAKISLEAPIFVSEQCWDRYRQHPNSNCSVVANAGRLQFARLTYLNWLVEYMSEKKVDNIVVWQALKRELWLHRVPAWSPLSDPTWKRVRWIKKWLLRLEEWVVPAPIRRWLWFR